MLGLAGAFALTRVLSRVLYGVGASDAVIFAAGALVLGLTGLAASYFPARRATRVPAVDAAWLYPLLEQADALLVRACADWSCPSGQSVRLVFSASVPGLPQPSSGARPAPPGLEDSYVWLMKSAGTATEV